MTSVHIRDAFEADSHSIAELFRQSSDGVADYIWDGLREDYPGLDLLEIGAQRYAREGVDFSYQNCHMAEADGTVAGMLHAYVMRDDEPLPDDFDPVLRPFAELEEPASLYVSGVAVFEAHRGQGIGSALMNVAYQKARDLACPSVSLIVFEQNIGALRLYQRLGFSETARRAVVPHEKIHHTGDALLMARAFET